jgi:DNA-binding MarR family transcriptional regulator
MIVMMQSSGSPLSDGPLYAWRIKCDMHMSVRDRVDQLLGVTALTAVDRLRAAVAAGPGVGEAEAGALVHLQAWPGCSVGELASVVDRSQPATVRLVDRLVDRGLVERRPGADRRTIALALTQAGSHAADAVLAARSSALSALLGGLSSDARDALERALEEVVGGAADDRPTAFRVCRLCDRGACCSGRGCPLNHTAGPPEGARSRGRS